MLSAMSVPDLKGSQGTYAYFSSDPHEHLPLTSGERIPVELDTNRGVIRSAIPGPENPLRRAGGEMRVPFEVKIGANGSAAELTVAGKIYPLKLKEYTPWIPLDFKAGLGFKVRGIVRFYLMASSPHLKLYMTPINIDPEKPALPHLAPVHVRGLPGQDARAVLDTRHGRGTRQR